MSDIVPAIQRITTNMNVPNPQALPGSRGLIPGLGGLIGKGLYADFLLNDIPAFADWAGSEAMSGLNVILGNQDRASMARGVPVIRSVNGTDYNISTEEGRAGLRRALDNGGQIEDTPPLPTPRSSTGPKTEGGNYTVSGVEYDGKTHQAINPDTGKVSPGGYSIDPKTGARTDRQAAPASAGPTGPQPATVSLPLLDLDGINSHLDTILSKGPDWEYAGNTQLADINTFLPGEIPTTSDNDGNQGATNTEVVVEGATATPQQPATDPDEGDAPRSVTVPGSEAPTNWAERQSNASRRAFLDHPGGSMAALRAAHAERGIYSQGGKYFTNIGGEATQVSKEDYDSYRLGNITAQEFKDRYTQQVIDTLEPSDPNNETADLETMGYTAEESQGILSDEGLETVIEPEEKDEK